MKKIILLIFLLGIVFIPTINVSANNYEAKIIVKGVSSNVLEEYNYETVEDAFKDATNKEALHNSSGKGGVVTVTIQLLKDSNVDETLVVDANNSNFMLDFNGNSIVSSADPVVQAGPMTFINNLSGEECSIVQKNVTTISTISPNTIFYAPVGTVFFDISASNLTIGDDTSIVVNSKAMLPSIMNGIFMGEMIIQKPAFGTAVRGGLFSEDPTPFIDTMAYDAVLNSDNLYYIVTYHAAPLDTDGNIIKKYGLLRDAIKDTEVNGTVKLLKQGYPDKTVVIEKDDIITLDLAGFQLTGAASPTAALRVEGDALIKNLGTLTIKDGVKSTSMNFVYDDYYKDEFFTTLHNKGIMNLENVGVYVNYNQPNYEGNIYTVTNDSRESDAIINISSDTRVGGINLEPEDLATGKYPAIMTIGNKDYKSEVNIEYNGVDNTIDTDNDMITYLTENVIIQEVMDVFDNEANYTTTFLYNDDLDLQKKNIKVTKDGVDIDFEYDSTTDKLTIPASNFTNDSDHIVISFQYEVSYVIDGKVVKTIMVESGKDAENLEIPERKGYIGNWDKDGKKIIEDTTITLIYTPIEIESPDTSDNIITYIIVGIMSLLALVLVPLKLTNN